MSDIPASPPAPKRPAPSLPSLLGMEIADFGELAGQAGLPGFAAKQLAKWVYEKRIFDPLAMTDLPKQGRESLAALVSSGTHAPVKATESKDGTKKYLFTAEVQGSGAKTRSRFIEAAYIPDRDRATLCVSSQVGCKMGCLFCATGRQGFQGQLSAAEILNQVVSIPETASLSNIVFMGMGEPFDNLDSVLKVLRVLTSPWGFAWSPRRITVSTVGVLPGLRRFLDESECHLAVSLHSPFHDERSSLMPVESAYELPELVAMIRGFDFGRQRRISFEYILFEGLNDSIRHVNEIARLLNGVNCRFNLIAFHAIPDSPLKPAPRSRLEWFRDELNRKGFTATIRASRGEDILAACGLLSTKELSKAKAGESL
ncbi:MAG TPA: 23S rRNA (adenine(2503)-C(2))-methyltransferase RlmN [Rectinemataceae bacterium]|nr:23S rRNA (adenine(2503)-C(2))-methyltransferase RlmN [Rectinemataceae bacterium]